MDDARKGRTLVWNWVPPIYQAGERISFWWREGVERTGRIMYVETRWGQHGPASEGSHTYTVMVDGIRGRNSHRYLGACDIIGLCGPASETPHA